ncbi:actin cytoskeleton and mitosis protein, partial [Coemansia sp. RSA 2708]
GNEEPLPEDLRTPETLLRTIDYLVDVVIAADQELQSCHGFVRDRTRSIRQDFTIQNIRDQTTVAACERIARFHIVSLHILCGNKDFAEHQDMEQLRNTLKTLIELYDDQRKARIACANEAEFYAYYIVSHLRDPDAKRVAERLPAHIFTAPVVQQALKLHMLSEANNVNTRRDAGNRWAAQNLAVQFFRAVAAPATPLLMACLAEYYFPSIRRAALRAMCDAFPYQEGKEYPVEEFAAMLAFDSVDEVRDFCAQFNVGLNPGGVKLGERAGGRIVFTEPAQQPRRVSPNLRVVGAKFHMSPMHAINTSLDQRFLGSGGRLAPKLSEFKQAAPKQPEPKQPEPPVVVWNQPRHRINWTSLTNALYHDLIGTLTAEVAAPVTSHAKQDAQVADTLATDITQSIVDYTSAFVAYEEAYRGLLFAQADAFRQRTLRRRVLMLWSMETAARLQDRALQQRYLDDLDEIIDGEYVGRPQRPLHNDDDDVFGALAAPNPGKVAAGRLAQATAPEGFWESLHLGADCFDTASRALTRFGSPSFRAMVDVAGTQGAEVLPTWLWWQLEPASIEGHDPSHRSAVYGSGPRLLAFREHADDDDSAATLGAQIVVLAPEPIAASDLRAASDDGGLVATVATRVEQALDRARARAATGGASMHPIMFVFWSSDGSAKAVRRLVERAASASGTPDFVAVHVLALSIASAKQQLGAGFKWLCRHLLQARKATLARVSKAFVPIVNALLQALQRMHGCVSGLVGSSHVGPDTQAIVFNLAVDTTNDFLKLLNERLFAACDTLQLGMYPHASEQTGLGRGYFDVRHGLPFALNSVVAAMLDDILQQDSPAFEPSLGSSLRALEFVVKHQLDQLQQSLPRNAYVDRRSVTQATRHVLTMAEQRMRQAAQHCQSASTMDWSPFVTPQAKRPSSLAFDMSPPTLDLGSVGSTRGSAAMSISSVSTTPATKRHRNPDSAQRLSRLQDAMARASKHLLD